MTSVEAAVETTAAAPVATRSPGQRAWGRFRRNRVAVVALGVLLLIHVAAALAPVLASHSPTRVNLGRRLKGPSAEHILGADENGRDVLARLLYGARISLSVGLASVTWAVGIGTVVGAVAGYRGGWVDSLLMRVTDAMLSIPLFFFMLTALALLGSSLANIVVVIGVTSWMNVARVVRGEVLRAKQLLFVEAARALGARERGVLFRHVVPQSMPSVIVAATLGIAWAILMESALSFLGLGVQPPEPSWGNMLSSARGYLTTAPHLAIFPGLLIFLVVLLYNYLGDGLRDAFDPSGSR